MTEAMAQSLVEPSTFRQGASLPIAQDHDGGAAAAAKVRQLVHQELKVHPVGGARFTHSGTASTILSGSTKAYSFPHCRGMGRERFEVVDDARSFSEGHQFLEGVLRKVAGQASAHWYF